MDLSQLINSSNISGILVVCGVMCVVGVVLFIALNFLGTIFGLLGGFLELGIDLITGGPVTWCGCLVVLAVLFICGATVLLLGSAFSSCGTPNATNLCTLLGR
ncbi:MAG: hypothetical protein KJ065_11960 [Anaerolineae bacterium]|nr:hypothetical protein [Anaerolineae bacterium]